MFVNIVGATGAVLRVTEKQFEAKFKMLGFRKLKHNKNNEEIEEENVSRETIETEENEIDFLETIPISDMTKEQLAQYAKNHGIDTSKARSVGEARKIVREAIKKQREQ